MAPALTEPLSPTEKLSNSAAATSVPVTRSTRRSRAAAAAAVEAATTTPTTPQPTTPVNKITNKERKRRSNSSTAIPVTAKTTALKVTTTRVTRSKDNASQRLSEQAAVPAECNNLQATTSSNSNSNNKNSSKNNIKIQKEPMGLSAALDTSSSNNNPNTSTSTDNKKDKDNSDSADKILADLATNIEEALSAEICLRKQLCDVNLSSEEAAKKTNGGTEIKNIDFVITSTGGDQVEEEQQEKEEEEEVGKHEEQQQLQHMDPVLQNRENITLEKNIEQHEKRKFENNNKNVDAENVESEKITVSSENTTAITTNVAKNVELDVLNEIIENEEQLQLQTENEEIVETTESPNLFTPHNVETTTKTTVNATVDAVASVNDEFDTIEGMS